LPNFMPYNKIHDLFFVICNVPPMLTLWLQ
jgi:hypothetical protein